MRIEGSSRSGPVSGRGAARPATGGAFTIEPHLQPSNVAQAAPISSSGGLEALLALQVLRDPLLAKRKAVRRGQHLLDGLEALRADLLSGRTGQGHLNSLLATLGQARESSQPGLDKLVDEIELRARVELAKYGIFP